jgi:hypothetical protein
VRRASSVRGDTNITLASATLVILIVATVALFLLVMKPHGSARFTVQQLLATPCPTGGGAPACYKATVTNIGGASGRMQCSVSPGEGTQALFLLSDLSTYSSATAVTPGESTTLWVKVDAGDGGTVTPPTVSCVSI